MSTSAVEIVARHVAQYFETKMGRALGEASFAELDVDTPCGQDCVKAIDAGAAFLEHVRAAVGEGSQEFRDHVDAVEFVCEVYWIG